MQCVCNLTASSSMSELLKVTWVAQFVNKSSNPVNAFLATLIFSCYQKRLKSCINRSQ